MGRNPVVGRQGPAYHAAAILTEAEAKQIKVTQIRSGIGHSDTMRKTLAALGLQEAPVVLGAAEQRQRARHGVQGAPPR